MKELFQSKVKFVCQGGFAEDSEYSEESECENSWTSANGSI